MTKQLFALSVVLLGVFVVPAPAAADWLLTGFISPITRVKTSEKESPFFPAEEFDGSTGFGVNLASAFPGVGGSGFELDFGWYGSALENSDQFGSDFASKLMTISTNFFYSPGIPRVRPYVAVGPTFTNRSDIEDLARVTTASSWAIGMNAGGGIFAFVNERFAGRFDVRYFRNFGDFVDLADIEAGGQGWNNLQFLRFSFGGTVVF